jgi:hypothetical protein
MTSSTNIQALVKDRDHKKILASDSSLHSGLETRRQDNREHDSHEW